MWWTLLACTPTPEPVGPGADTAALALQVEPSAHVDNVFAVSWAPAEPATVELLAGSEVHRYHDVLPPLDVVGLAPATDWLLSVHTDDGLATDTLRTAEPPSLLASLSLAESHEGSEVAGGYVLANLYDHPTLTGYAVVIDGQGRPVWWVPAHEGRKLVRARLSADGAGVLWAVTGWNLQPDQARVGITTFDGRSAQVWSTPGLHHEVVEVGSELHYLAHEVDDDLVIGLFPTVPTASDVVRVLDRDTGELSDGFAFFDHYPFTPYSPCSHAQLPSFLPGAVEWTHSNSLVPFDDGWLILPRYLDALVHVRDDQFVWQAGGRDTTLTPATDDALTFHGHLTHAWADRALVFDNRSHTDEASRLVELQFLPEEGRYQVVWSQPEPRGRYIDFLGDARRLPSGGTLVAWSPLGEIEELTDDGATRWHVDSDGVVGRVEFVPTLPGDGAG